MKLYWRTKTADGKRTWIAATVYSSNALTTIVYNRKEEEE